MYSATVHTLVKTLGTDRLICVNDLIDASDTNIFQVVVKKYKRWSFQSPKYSVTEFKLNQILRDSDILDVPSYTNHLLEYHQEKEFDIKGEIGAKLCEEIVNVTLDLNDSVTLSAKCGVIGKRTVDVPELMKKLHSKHLDFHHPLVKQVREDRHRVLCVITEVVYLENEGLLHSRLDYKKSASLKANTPNLMIGNVEASTEYDKENDKAFKIPAGTALAYAVCELIITKTGRIELVVVDGAEGGFGAYDSPDHTDDRESVSSNRISEYKDMPASEMFAGLIEMTSVDRDHARQVIQMVMLNTRLIKPLLKQLKRAYKAIDGTVSKTTTVDILRNDISSDSSDWKPFLTVAGFHFANDGEVTYTQEKSALLESCRCLLEGLCELDGEVIRQMRKVDITTGTALVALLRHSVFSSNSMNIDRPGLSSLINIKDLLMDLGFKIADNVVLPPDTSKFIQAAYRVVYALWGC